MSQIKTVAVCGAAGRMGQELISLLRREFPETQILGVDRHRVDPVEMIPIENLSDADVVIDFSQPELFRQIVPVCIKASIPLVSGTTGLSESDFENLQKLGSVAPTLWSSNMSLGIAVIKKMISTLEAMPGADFFIEDFHHNKKVDAPSGTALTLSQCFSSAPEISSHRAGGIYGVHKLNAVTDEEHIVISHSALNRSVFAKGALRAAQWVVQQPARLYTMDDLI